jgi:hypothetical protein
MNDPIEQDRLIELLSRWEVMTGVGPDRGSVRPALGAPPLAGMCRALSRGGAVAEAVAFPVEGKEGKR